MGLKDIFKKQKMEKQNTEKKMEYFTDKLPDEVFATAKSLQKTSRKVVEEIEQNLIANTNDNCFENAPQSKEITNLYHKMEKKCDTQEIAATFYIYFMYVQVQYLGKIMQTFSKLNLPLPELNKIDFDPMNPFVTNQRIADAFYPIFLQEKDTLHEKVNNYLHACCAVELMYAFDYIKRQEVWMSGLFGDFYNDPVARQKTLDEVHKYDGLYSFGIKSFIDDDEFAFAEGSEEQRLYKMMAIFYMIFEKANGSTIEERNADVAMFGYNF